MRPSVELPNLPSCKELVQRRARAWAVLVLTRKAVNHYQVIGPAAVRYIASRHMPTVAYTACRARRLGVIDRIRVAFFGLRP